MQRVSTNLTLFYKIFIPTFWIVFFGAVLVASLLLPYQYVGNIPRLSFQIGMVLFFASGVAVLYFTLMSLKRVELDRDFLYATNYFKTYRYPYHNIEKIEVSRFLFFSTATVHLRKGGSFGRRFRFVPSLFCLKDFLETHPDIGAHLEVEGL